MPAFQTSPGMRDILAPESARWRAFTDVFAGVVEPAGYELVIPPMMESNNSSVELWIWRAIPAATMRVS